MAPNIEATSSATTMSTKCPSFVRGVHLASLSTALLEDSHAISGCSYTKCILDGVQQVEMVYEAEVSLA